MKATGIVRKVDNLGRIVIPMELRRKMDINSGDPVEIYADDGIIILMKYKEACILCGGKEGLVEFSGKLVCRDCIEAVK